MEHTHDFGVPTMRPEGSGLSDLSMDSSSTFVTSPSLAASVHHRPVYQRVPTLQEEDISYHGAANESDDKGLGIQNLKGTAQGPSIEVSLSGEDSPAVPGSAGYLRSPTLSRSSKKSYRALQDTPEEEGEYFPDGHSRSPSLYTPYASNSESETLRRVRASSTLSPYGPTGGEHPDFTCTTKKHFHHPRGDLPSILILIASAFSTAFSGIWLGLATGKPHYGQMITHGSRLPPSTASLLVAAFAKAIELTFVTSFVAFLGQVLSQRAFRKNSKGISVAEMQMRQWILQPGTLLTHSAAVRYAAITFLGATAVLAALLAMFYTTASDALVSPKLKFGDVQNRMLYGKVTASFANETYIQDQCATPIPIDEDPLHGAQTCLAIQHSGQAYHNYAQYLTNWTSALAQGTASTDLAKRPPPLGTLYDNTTILGSWIDIQDMAANCKSYNRVVNNVSLAMPLSAVFAAAMDPLNRILQPQDLDGLGEYFLEASVPSPAINVLCAAMTKEELTPIVANEWPAYSGSPLNSTLWANGGYNISNPPSWLNATAVDGIFGFGEKYGRRPPIFPLLPQPFNTVMNFTSYPLMSDSLYILVTSNDSSNSPYMMCSLRASLSPECSTQLHSTMSGGSLTTHCEEPDNHLAYSRSQPSATSGVYQQGWRDVITQWGLAVSLDQGINDGDASNARLLSQLIPTEWSLDPKLPSIAEALAVMAGSTLIMSALDAPFIHFWNYTDPNGTLDPPQYQQFNASLQVQDYSSGGTQHWQGLFYIVLASVFLVNLMCLGYFITHTGLVTDFMEPQNLFALSLNSPPSQVLEGTCGGGPESEQYKSSWHIWMNQSEHFYIESTDDPLTRRRTKHRGKTEERDIPMHSPVSDMYDRLSAKRTSLL